MSMPILCLFIVLLPFSNAAALTVRQFNTDNGDQPKGLTWERIEVPVHGQTPVGVAVSCTAELGVGLEARSCFNTLEWAPDSTRDETWVASDRAPPPGLQDVVRLPVMVLDSGDNKLAVRVMAGPPNPPVCSGPIQATPRSCRYILDEMYKGNVEEIFGRPEAASSPPRVTFALPLTRRSPDGLCQIVIDTTRPEKVQASWRQIWGATEYINAQCVRNGKGGTSMVRGKIPVVVPGPAQITMSLFVKIMDEPGQLTLPGESHVSGQVDLAAAAA
ncbi:MAG: hypothetical protein Q9213_004710 [Squamulea squamosa]